MSELGFFEGKVLVVEDDEDSQIIADYILGSLQLDFEIAENGIKALELIKKNEKYYDVIFMDIAMPGKSGIEVTKEIRNLEGNENKNTLIIALTAMSSEYIEKECTDVGFDGVLSKPFAKDMVVGIINEKFK